MVDAARSGDVGQWATCSLAARGVDPAELSEEAEAGALLEAYRAHDLREIAAIARAWVEANSR